MSDTAERPDIEAIRANNAKAHAMVSALCKPRGSAGAREWLMSIPAQPDYDPDLVIGRSLNDNDHLLAYIERLERAAMFFGQTDLIGYDVFPNLYGCDVCHGSGKTPAEVRHLDNCIWWIGRQLAQPKSGTEQERKEEDDGYEADE
jgi:hypothetical protein